MQGATNNCGSKKPSVLALALSATPATAWAAGVATICSTSGKTANLRHYEQTLSLQSSVRPDVRQYEALRKKHPTAGWDGHPLWNKAHVVAICCTAGWGGGGAVVASGEGGYSTARKEGDKIFKPQLGLRRCRLQPCFELVFIVRGPAERAAPCRRTSPRLRVPLLCLPSCSTRTPTISITTATKKPTNAIPTAGNNLFRRHSDHLQRSSLQYICYVQHLALIQHLRAFPTR